ncbi:MAG: tRNA (guanosine(46)-N7)-methyltransferase TrmB [Chryseobacterium sp.]|nr:MAG: tRNA (guanosine(46)-N7)-methyltransferase TrmB [Chryseobacterium sp.]
MGRKKLERFEDNKRSRNVIEVGKEHFGQLQGKWNTDFFPENQPIILEIGCGKGEYTVGLAAEYPQNNYIGADVKGSRIWKGSQVAEQQNLHNVAFLRTQVERITDHFSPEEVSEIWITFPDPRPKDFEADKRLTSPKFLELYRKIIKQSGIVRFKTDNRSLFDYTLEMLQGLNIVPLAVTFDFYNSEYSDLVHGIKTTYESRYVAQGLPIHYLAFTFGADLNLA